MASKKLGEVLRELRESKGLSQPQLAERASIALSYVIVSRPGTRTRRPGRSFNGSLEH